MDSEFGRTLERPIEKLRNLTTIDDDLENLLIECVKKKKLVSASLFHEKGLREFMSASGRNSMIEELQRCRDLFKETDVKLEAISHNVQA